MSASDDVPHLRPSSRQYIKSIPNDDDPFSYTIRRFNNHSSFQFHTMSCENCKSGFNWNGTPTGSESKVGNTTKAYVTGDNKDVAVLLIHDIFGWTFPNLRLLADHFAKEANVTVYLPDLYVYMYYSLT
jgi:hypothetical protein